MGMPQRDQLNGRSIRVLIVDDHPLVRESLKAVIRREPDLSVCGEAEDRNGALDLAGKIEPHLAIVDLTLKNSSGLELVKALHDLHPSIRILVLSMQDEVVMAVRAVRAGARGYIGKNESSAKVLEAIRQVLNGEIYWTEKAANCIASRIARSALAEKSGAFPPEDVLTDRELQVFSLIGKGRSTRQIATELFIGTSTVETYRSRIKEKLNLQSAADLLQCAISSSNHQQV